jgi:hypothetical protein
MGMMDGEEAGMRVGAFFGILMVEMVFGAVPLLMRRFIHSTHLRDRLLSLGNAFAGGLFLAGGFGASPHPFPRHFILLSSYTAVSQFLYFYFYFSSKLQFS